jgi:TP901 family phage tail tape measure protein
VGNQFEAEFVAKDNISPIVKQITQNIEKLIQQQNKLIATNEKLNNSALGEKLSEVNKLLAQQRSELEKIRASAEGPIETYSKLSKALQGGFKGIQKLTAKDIVGESPEAINQLKARLKEVGVTLTDFRRKGGGSLVTDEAIARAKENNKAAAIAALQAKNFESILDSINSKRKELGKKPLELVDVKNAGLKQAFAEVKALEEEIRKISLTKVFQVVSEKLNTETAALNKKREAIDIAIANARNTEGMVLGGKGGLGSAVNLNQGQLAINQLDKLNKKMAEGASISGFENVVYFNSLRRGSIQAVADVERLQRELKKLQTSLNFSRNNGDTEAEKKISEQIKSTISLIEVNRKAAVKLASSYQDAYNVANKMLVKPSASLQKFGYAPITINDLFPTQEQEKLKSLKARISGLTEESIRFGAVKDSLNSFLKNGSKLPEVTQSIVDMTDRLPRLRYALYDVSNSFAVFGAAAVGIPALIAKIGISFDRDFANVIRTATDPGDNVDKLKKSFISLAQTIPVSFQELSSIGTLAGQLNIPLSNIANFTKTVSMFAATTDVSANEAATAFGRLDQLINGVNGQYDRLGSAILAVGVNSVATESQIVRIAQQIASIANLAKFSADQVIGLSGALASVGTTPELSRGLFTRLFTELNGAVTGANGNLQSFASLAGQTAEEFKKNWATEGNSAWQIVKVLQGLNAQGPQAEQTLRSLNIASVRDIPTVLKLAQGYQEVTRQLLISQSAYLAGTELQRQYNIITSTVSEKLNLLVNNFQVLAATISESTTFFGPLIDVAIGFVKILQKIADNPVAATIFGIAGAVAALIGVISLIASAFIRFSGNIAGSLTALIELRTVLANTKLAIDNAAASFRDLAGAQTYAAGASDIFVSALQAVDGSQLLSNGEKLPQNIKAVGDESKNAVPKIKGTASGFKALGVSLGLATAETNIFKYALRGLLVSSGIGIALTGISFLFDAIGEASKSAAQKASDFFGGLDLSDSIKSDTQAWLENSAANKNADDTYSTFLTKVKTSAPIMNELERSIFSSSDAMNQLAASTTNANGQIEQYAAVGKNTAKAISEAFVKKLREEGKNNPLNQLFDDKTAWEAFKNSGVTAAKAIELTLSQGKDAAIKYINNGLDPLISKTGTYATEVSKMGTAYMQTSDAIMQSNGYQELATKGYDASSYRMEQAKQSLIQLVEQTYNLTEEQKKQMELEQVLAVVQEDLKTATEKTTDALNAYKSSISDAFNLLNSSSSATTDFAKLAKGISESGFSLNSMTESGVTSLKNLQDSLATTMGVVTQMGGTASEGVAILIRQLVNQGIGSANQLVDYFSRLDIPDVSISIVQSLVSGQTKFSESAQKVSDGYDGISASANAAASSSENVANKLQSVTDYASTLSSVFSRTFEIRFSSQTSFDKITKAFVDLKKSVKDANKQIEDINTTISALNADITKLTADKSLQEYFLRIANSFGDSIRAQQISADIAKIDAEILAKRSDLTSQTENLTEAQGLASKTLVGNSEAAINNREKILTLVSAYQDHIQTLAKSGSSQEELAAKTQQLEQDFYAQAEQLGYSREEVDKYGIAFKDMSTAITNVPRNIDIEVNLFTDPAKAALDELVRKTAESTNSMTKSFVDWGDVSQLVLSKTQQQLWQQERDILLGQTKNPAYMKTMSSDQRLALQERLYDLNSKLGYEFASGGYTGAGGKYDVAGIVHKGEYVVPREQVNQATKVPYFMSQQPRFFQGNSAQSSAPQTMVVELSPYDRRLLAQAGNVQLAIDGKVVAGATNNVNNVYAQRGAN